ncbi:curli production assembly/transport component CsgG [Hymenobacter taeanensis]|uniref:Curli production assembly/transport component CsgG n=1 Tax=Hymenobacter taeanensis TaxID=2735321 RepID=A0A6M6BHQ5_9BACT|nr:MULTISPECIES: CsgG/HfaB family protein [Hymenobacter]QJX46575.1 curli production assembly/transport component CsgG [Hymenobacter taeanensis]UOQ80435.1 curli production assembly/transport component CsgG [Hymenobacter sp. 5414T-23]
MKSLSTCLGGLVGLLLTGCSPYFHQPFSTERARLGAEVNGNQAMQDLPTPRLRTVVAVYKFRDQTGQYKPQTNGSSFSTAITQGTTTILLRALEESGWFDPIERENLGNLLNERKIIRSTRAEFTEQTGVKQPVLPPLLFAGTMLEGGIISYDANMLTGGAGLRYFGAGASGQYRQDRVTVYLRAISTSNGRILKTVYTSKTILSQQVDASLFRFVNFKRLLETETGFTYNEPSEMAVKEAIEKAVQALIYEGMLDGLWLPKDSTDLRGPKMRQYVQEREYGKHYDVLGRQVMQRQPALGLSLTAGAQRYAGDYASPQTRPVVHGMLSYQLPGGRWSPFVAGGQGRLASERFFNQRFYYAEAGVQTRLLPTDRFTPYLMGAAGATLRASGSVPGRADQPRVVPHVTIGAGLEYQVNSRVSVTGGIDGRLFLRDDIDGANVGRYNDNSAAVRAGLVYLIQSKMRSTSADK